MMLVLMVVGVVVVLMVVVVVFMVAVFMVVWMADHQVCDRKQCFLSKPVSGSSALI